MLLRVRGAGGLLATACAAAEAKEESHSGGIRPVKVTASASCALLAVLNVYCSDRNVLTAIQVGPDALAHLLVGRGSAARCPVSPHPASGSV